MNVAILIDCWEDKPKTLLSRLMFYFFCSRQVYWNIKRFVTSKNIQTIIIASYDGKNTSPELLRVKKHQVEMLDIESLRLFLTTNDVAKIYMCGCAWDICVRDRPLGYLNVFNLISKLYMDIDILVKADCVKNSDDSYFDLDSNKDWHPTETSGVFKFAP